MRDMTDHHTTRISLRTHTLLFHAIAIYTAGIYHLYYHPNTSRKQHDGLFTIQRRRAGAHVQGYREEAGWSHPLFHTAGKLIRPRCKTLCDSTRVLSSDVSMRVLRTLPVKPLPRTRCVIFF